MADEPFLIFDWGNTLMKVYPQFQGPMADWPIVSAEDGAVSALAGLSKHYRLIIATNAGDSDGQSIRAALARVALDGFFEQIYTVQDLQARKPDPLFFVNLTTRLGQPSQRLIMIGDDFQVDVVGAWQAGLRTVWYNSAKTACPGLLPVHSMEITHLSQLPAALDQPALPDIQTCQAWMLRMGTSPKLINHVQIVAAIAYQMAVWLRAEGIPVDPLLAQRGGLVHDLGKIAGLRSRGLGKNHGQIAEEFLLAQNQPALAAIARKHLLFCIRSREEQSSTWEEKLVFFADKLVEREQIEPLETRLAALTKRYPTDAEKILACKPQIMALQVSFCEHLHISAVQLIEQLRKAILEG